MLHSFGHAVQHHATMMLHSFGQGFMLSLRQNSYFRFSYGKTPVSLSGTWAFKRAMLCLTMVILTHARGSIWWSIKASEFAKTGYKKESATIYVNVQSITKCCQVLWLIFLWMLIRCENIKRDNPDMTYQHLGLTPIKRKKLLALVAVAWNTLLNDQKSAATI